MLPRSRSAARTSRCPRARTTPWRWSRLAVKLGAWGDGSTGLRSTGTSRPRGTVVSAASWLMHQPSRLGPEHPRVESPYLGPPVTLGEHTTTVGTLVVEGAGRRRPPACPPRACGSGGRVAPLQGPAASSRAVGGKGVLFQCAAS